ncbi:hypothetical protein [Paenibacillus piscarius]|uniref:hypothetical protein n=1 Tax=Paenibacillus piscarius TaxID=1089681 RepID=UPI001EE8CEB3|nr:hypothetical protein [Paenibacillus piscarius]
MTTLNSLPADGKPLKVYGSQTCRGDMEASSVEVLGHLHVRGKLTAARLRLRGECSVAHSCCTQELHSFGSLRTGSLQAEKAAASGYLSVASSAHADEFRADGAVRIGRLSCTAAIHIELGSVCRIRHMTCEGGITISPSSRLLNIPMRPFRKLSCETIEGADITLYKTQAGLVCGHNVTVGPGCTIGEVRYRDRLTLHPQAQVGKITRINDTGGI